MGVFIALVFGLLIGGALGWFVARREPRWAPGEGRVASARSDLARAWQEGYDAGSATSTASAGPIALATTASRQPPQPPSGPVWVGPGLASPAQPGLSQSGLPQSVPPEARPPQARTAPSHAPSPFPPAPQVPRVVSPGQSPQEWAAEKERRDRRNVNITLYTACLLLVAAASLFIGSALPVTARVAGLAVVVGLFYVGGLVVHTTSRTLRPAATAFTGTGLALVPVAGVALDVLVLHDPVLAWLLTSAAGTAMMVLAAVRLDSRIVAYLTVPFLLSTVMASGAAVQQGMVWALIASIGLAVLMAWISAEDSGRNRGLPESFRAAFAQTHQWIVPAVVVLGMLVGVWLEPVQMFLLLLAACAYYATVAVIGPERFRLPATYAVRCGVLVALIPWGLMLDWSADLMLTSLVAYLCLQVPLVWWGAGTPGYLPTGVPAMVDHAVSGLVAVALAASSQAAALVGPVGGTVSGPVAGTEGLVRLTSGIGVAAALVVVTTAVFSLLFLQSNRLAEVGASGNANLLWQATTPIALLPLLIYPLDHPLGHPLSQSSTHPIVNGAHGWNLEIALLVIMTVEAVALVLLRRHGHGPRIDARIAPHVIAACGVALVYLAVSRWTDPAAGPAPALTLTALAAVLWATITALQALKALRRGALTGEADDAARRPAGAGVPVAVWSGASLLAVLLLLTPPLSQGGVLLGWYVLTVVTAAVALAGLGAGGRGAATTGSLDGRPQTPVGDRHPVWRMIVLSVGALTLLTATLRFASAAGVSPWHLVAGLALLTGWLVAAAVVARDRLPQATRTGMLLAGQASSAVLVSTVVDRLGGNESAARAAAVVALVAGLALRSHVAGRLPGPVPHGGSAGFLTGPTTSWLVTGAVAVLWFVELAAGEGDRAALMVMALALIGAGLVLRVRTGGHWAVLAGTVELVVAASAWFDLTGGWLPAALFPTSAAVAMALLLTLSVAAGEIAVSAGHRAPGAGSDPTTASWLNDLGLFRPVAAASLWAVALVLGLTGDAEQNPHFGALGMTAAVAGLVLYVFARTRGIVGLVAGTVVGVPVSWWLLSTWWMDRGLWFPEEAWTAVVVGVLSAVLLGLWALSDARRDARGARGAGGVAAEAAGVAGEDDPAGTSGRRVRPAILWQGGLAALLVLALGTVVTSAPRAGQPGDAVVWTALALLVAGSWLTVDAWGRTLLWESWERAPGGPLDQRGHRVQQARWVLLGRDAATLLTLTAGSRAWWQTAVVEEPGRAGWWNVQLLVLVLVGLGFRHVLRARSLVRQGERGTKAGRRHPLAYFGAAAGVFTLAALYVLANGTALMQLTVLGGFALLVLLGLTRREQLLTWWGAAGVAVSVLWYLRGYTYVYLALLGLVLIVLAVRQLRRHQARPSSGSPDLDPVPRPDPDPDPDRAEKAGGR